MISPGHKTLLYICIFLSACLLLLSAFLNFSYIHPDEYFQIVEFASYKLGITSAAVLAWEFDDRIRPGLQPLMAYEIFRLLDAVNVRDHFTQLFFLRILSACFSLFCITVFCMANMRLILTRYQKLYILATFLFWAPYLFGVRFSSEAWSGGCVLLATSILIYLDTNGSYLRRPVLFFATGILLGVAFLFRFQTAFFTLGIGLWLLIVRRERYTAIAALIGGGLLSLCLGLVTDKWLYGDWVCSQWLYFESNILKGVASEFGTRPFYTYAVWLLAFLSPAVGAVALFCLLLLFFRLPRHLYTWLLLPFLLAHSATGHKEVRFIFPLMLYIPVVCIIVYQYIMERQMWGWLMQRRDLRTTTIVLLLICNFGFLYFFAIDAYAYSNDPKNLAPYIHAEAKKSVVNLIYVDPSLHPYILGHSRYKANVYPLYLSEKNVLNTQIKTWDFISSVPYRGRMLVSATRYEWNHIPSLVSLRSHRILIASTFPDWMQSLPVGRYLGQGVQDGLDQNTFQLMELYAGEK